MEEFYILDTCSFYSYCCKYLNIFTDKDISLDDNSLEILYKAFNSNNIKIIIPSVIIIEISVYLKITRGRTVKQNWS